MPTRKEILQIGGREVSISNPDKVYFPDAGVTKMDLVNYYLAVADGALRGAGGRPMALKRFVDGITKEPFFQKRAPDNTPDWMRTAELTFPSGRTADEIVVDEAAGLAWIVNLGCIDLNPHPVRADDLDHPDELRVDLDPGPGIGFDDVRRVALLAKEALDVRPGPPRRVGVGPRGRAPRAGAGHEQVVEGRASRRLPRLQPERERPHRRFGVFRASDDRRARLHAARLG